MYVEVPLEATWLKRISKLLYATANSRRTLSNPTITLTTLTASIDGSHCVDFKVQMNTIDTFLKVDSMIVIENIYSAIKKPNEKNNDNNAAICIGSNFP